jgi:hypothetical protein
MAVFPGGILTLQQQSENDTSTCFEDKFIIATNTQSSSGLQNKKQESRVASRKTLKIKKKRIRTRRTTVPLFTKV